MGLPFFFYLLSFVDFAVENISERFARVVADYSSFQAKVKQRLSKLETEGEKEQWRKSNNVIIIISDTLSITTIKR